MRSWELLPLFSNMILNVNDALRNNNKNKNNNNNIVNGNNKQKLLRTATLLLKPVVNPWNLENQMFFSSTLIAVTKTTPSFYRCYQDNVNLQSLLPSHTNSVIVTKT